MDITIKDGIVDLSAVLQCKSIVGRQVANALRDVLPARTKALDIQKLAYLLFNKDFVIRKV